MKGLGHKDSSINRKEISSIIEKNSELSGSTPKRRAITVISWFQWISKSVGIVTVKNGEIRLRLKEN